MDQRSEDCRVDDGCDMRVCAKLSGADMCTTDSDGDKHCAPDDGDP